MKKYAVLFLFLFLLSCEKEISSLSDLQSNFFEFQNKAIHLGETIEIEFNKNTDKIDSVLLFLDEVRLKNNSLLDSSNASVGLHKLEMKVYVDGDSIYGKTDIPILSAFKEKLVDFTVVNSFPHPAELFTEGLIFHDNKLYESAGGYGKSKLVIYTLGTTRYLKEQKQEKEYFSEGIAFFNGKIYQFTYRQRKIFVYNAETLQLVDTMKMPNELREGWGLTTNGREFIGSDGSQNLYFFDEKFVNKRKIQVAGFSSIYTNLNELEFLNNRIYANVWQTNFILIINPESGVVEQYLDLSSLSETKGSDDVLNGIAGYQNNLLITGKNWSSLFELELR